jgi:hypothetical protein
VPALADQIHDYPSILPLLKIFEGQVNQFRSPQSTAEQQREHCSIPLAAD